MQRYSVAVAMFDFLPVAICAFGLGLLARIITRQNRGLAAWAWLAAALITAGGLCKAAWKLLVAARGLDLPVLENLLFIAMAPGFVMMSFCFRAARNGGQPGGALAAMATAPLVVAFVMHLSVSPSRLWFFWLLAVTVVANAMLIAQAIGASRSHGLRWPAVLFSYNFIAVLALSGLSRLPAGETTAWLQEAVNVSAQAAFALGAWLLSQRLDTEGPVRTSARSYP